MGQTDKGERGLKAADRELVYVPLGPIESEAVTCRVIMIGYKAISFLWHLGECGFGACNAKWTEVASSHLDGCC